MTMVKYRCEYGKSLLHESIDDLEVMIKLIYVAITGDKDYYHIFKNECLADNSFELSALSFYKELLLKDCPMQKTDSENNDNETDEFEILALCSIANVPDRLLDTLNIFQLVKLINRYCEIKNATPKPKEMNKAERKAMYGITPDKEKQIEAYLLHQSEVK